MNMVDYPMVSLLLSTWILETAQAQVLGLLWDSGSSIKHLLQGTGNSSSPTTRQMMIRKASKSVKRVKGKNGKPDSVDLLVQVDRVRLLYIAILR